ncbi:hypothetical protein AAF712_006560 [Marasmius tenuissimus]|uniref:2',3'-cyclic-nucleotide 3'-phosphodiesterase n=1 Tax=Marasmius tenuissimus TaxID=585030 RepID=A0ABR2ZZN3_9AGAR
MVESKDVGVTLWIVPSEGEMVKLERIMDIRPSSGRDTEPASYPKFDPHITLASLPSSTDISISQLRESIPKDQRPLKVHSKSVDIGDHFFRSVYIAVNLSSELVELHRRVHDTLKVEPRTPTFPHISLCYITDSDAANGERQRYHEELQSTRRICKEDDGNVALNCGVDEEDWVSGFVASEIWVAECEGPVETWKILDKISLS